MARTRLQDQEQLFLQIAIIGRYQSGSNNPDFSLNSHFRNYDSLLEDIASELEKTDKLEEDINNTRSFPAEDSDFSTRVLRDFFYYKKSLLNTSTIHILYKYIFKGEITRTEFIKEYPNLVVNVDLLERRRIVDGLWYLYRNDDSWELDNSISNDSEEDIDQTEDIYQWICSRVDRKHPRCCLHQDQIMLFFDDRDARELTVTVLDTLYLCLSDNQFDRNSYLTEYPDFINRGKQIEKDKVLFEDREWFSDPIIPLGGLIFCGVSLVFIYFLLSNKEFEFKYSLLSIILFALVFAGWFFSLYRQAIHDTKVYLQVHDFWSWWFQGIHLSRLNDTKTKVRVLVIHDDCYDVQKQITAVKQNYKIVQTTMFVQAENNLDELREVLWSNSIEGLYFLLTEDIERLSLPIIREWAVKFNDIPIVYVDYIGKELEFGRIEEKEKDDAGLWRLLSQSLNRGRLWKEKEMITKKYAKLWSRLYLLIITVFLLLALYENHDSTKQAIKLNKAHRLNQSMLLTKLNGYRKAYINFLDGKEENLTVNFSFFGISPDSTEIWQYESTENDDSGKVSFPMDMVKSFSVVGNAFERADNYRAVMVIRSKKDSSTLLGKGYSTSGDLVDISVDSLYTEDKDPLKVQDLSGLICLASDDLGICIELINSYDFMTTALQDSLPQTIGFMQNSISELKQMMGNDHRGGFPTPTVRY